MPWRLISGHLNREAMVSDSLGRESEVAGPPSPQRSREATAEPRHCELTSRSVGGFVLDSPLLGGSYDGDGCCC